MVHVIDLLGAPGEKDSATQMGLFVSQRHVISFFPCHRFLHHMVDSSLDLISGLHRIDVNSELAYQFLPCHRFLRRIVNSFSVACLISGLYRVDVNSGYHVSFSVVTGCCITWSIPFQVQILFQV